jgi:trimeric autotransporter adhesin
MRTSAEQLKKKTSPPMKGWSIIMTKATDICCDKMRQGRAPWNLQCLSLLRTKRGGDVRDPMTVKGRRSALSGITLAALMALLLSLAGAGLFAQNALAQSYTISACSDCHGDPPIDGARNATTGAVLGSHTKHSSSGEYAYTCTVCHVNVPRTPTPAYNHRDGNINMISPLNAHSGIYSNPAGNTFPQTNTPTLYSCSTTYCHSAATGGTTQTGDARPVAANTSPVWGAAGPLACSACHGKEIGNDGTGRPWYISGTPKANTHVTSVKHASLSCDKCHNQTTTTGTTITEKTIHADRQYQIVGTGISPYNFTYSYVSTGGTCATAYCHSTGQGSTGGVLLAGDYKSPNWGGAGLNCDGCHKNMDTDGTASGSHVKHGQGAVNYPCATCHSGYTETSYAAATHVDLSINLGFGGTAIGTTYSQGATHPVGDNYGTCSTSYCHSNAKGASIVYATPAPAWGTDNGTLTCASCHGNPPSYASGAAGSLTANTHVKHVTDSGIGCQKCHNNTTTDGTTIRTDITPSNHADGSNTTGSATEDVVFDTGGTYTYGATNKSCSTTYCHGTAAVQWGGPATTCSTCHSSMGAGTGTVAYLGGHQKHANATTYKLACDNCHDPDQASHAGGLADATVPQRAAEVLFENAGTAGTWLTRQYNGGGTIFNYTRINQSPYGLAAPTPVYAKGTTAGTADNGFPWTTNGSCSSVWCHSNANPRTRTTGETAGSLNSYRSAAFNTTTTCTSCHLGPAAVATMTAATDRLSTNHADHVATDRYGISTRGADQITCNFCHNNTASNNTTISSFANHVNALKDVAMNTWSGGTWSAPSCSTVYCHSSATRLGITPATEYRTPSWADSAITTCIVCHQGPANAATMTGRTGVDRMSSAHIKHIASDRHGANTNYNCNTCHSGIADSNTAINTTTGYGLHVNKTNNVAINTYGGSGTWNTPATTCSTTYCHSKGTGATAQTGDVRAVSVNTSTAWTGTITACNICHGTESGTLGAPAYANLRRSPTAATGTGWTFTSGSLGTAVGSTDNNYAIFNTTTQAYLYITNFGFTTTDVPDGSTIRDITVIIEGNGTSATVAERQLRVALTKTGSAVVGTAKSDATTQLYQTSDRELVLGGTNDLWGTTLTPAEIRAAGFGVAISDSNTTANALNIDRVRVVVHTDAAPKKNSHPNHAALNCSACHSGTVSTGNSPITGFAAHVDKTYNVAGTNISAYTYNVAGGTCSTSCHGGLSGTAASGVPQWGVSEMDCVICHSSIVNAPVATTLDSAVTQRRAVALEFNNTWSHKRSAGGAVTKFDCIVCHMEGDKASGSTNATHANGRLNLRDPDTGLNIKGATWSNTPAGAGSYAPTATDAAPVIFSRNLSSNVIEADAAAIMVNHCLKCHDTSGALSADAQVSGGSAEKPFATTISGAGYAGGTGMYTGLTANNITGGVTDINASFATTNSAYHPIRGKQNNWYAKLTRMVTPWNTATRGATADITSWGHLMTCWDCHAPVSATGVQTSTVTAHGAAATLRGTATVTGTPAAGTNEATLCKVCHAGYDTSTSSHHNTGSALASNTNTNMNVYLRYGCNYCHSSSITSVRPVRGEDVHGLNRLRVTTTTDLRWPTGATETSRPYAFIRNTITPALLTNHRPLTATGELTTGTAACASSGSTNPCSDTMGTYTPGGRY